MNPKLQRTAFVAIVALVGIATQVCAQGTVNAESATVSMPCRGTERAAQADRAFKVLASSDPETQRALSSIGVAPQPASAVHGVLRVASACARLRAVLRKHILSGDEPSEGLKNADLSFVELGDYYGVIVTTTTGPTIGVRRGGPAPLYLFDKRSMSFVARLAI